VWVFQGDRLVRRFDVPLLPGTLWTVFELDGTTITTINRMTFVQEPDDVLLVRPDPWSSDTDDALIRSTTTPKLGATRTTRTSE
jgi:hypothetical protein